MLKCLVNLSFVFKWNIFKTHSGVPLGDHEGCGAGVRSTTDGAAPPPPVYGPIRAPGTAGRRSDGGWGRAATPLGGWGTQKAITALDGGVNRFET